MSQEAYMVVAIAIVCLVALVVFPRLFKKPAPPTAEDMRRDLIERTRIALFEARVQRENYEAECTKLAGRLGRLLNEVDDPARRYDGTTELHDGPSSGVPRVRAINAVKEAS